jgi:hypothetical protein
MMFPANIWKKSSCWSVTPGGDHHPLTLLSPYVSTLAAAIS